MKIIILDSINSEPSVPRHIIIHVRNIFIVSINSEPSAPRYPCIIRVNTDGIELNWIYLHWNPTEMSTISLNIMMEIELFQ